jgi:hypothetical protein
MNCVTSGSPSLPKKIASPAVTSPRTGTLIAGAFRLRTKAALPRFDRPAGEGRHRRSFHTVLDKTEGPDPSAPDLTVDQIRTLSSPARTLAFRAWQRNKSCKYQFCQLRPPAGFFNAHD